MSMRSRIGEGVSGMNVVRSLEEFLAQPHDVKVDSFISSSANMYKKTGYHLVYASHIPAK